MEAQSSTLGFSGLLNSASNYREAHIAFDPGCLFIIASVKYVALVGFISKFLVPEGEEKSIAEAKFSLEYFEKMCNC